MHPFLAKLFADTGYQAPQFADAVANCLRHLAVEIVKRSEQRRAVDALGGGAHPGMAQSLPTPGQELREPYR